ncbi:MAG: type II secretion system minor pseudopilin GspK [Burkholderiaceae bacterium]
MSPPSIVRQRGMAVIAALLVVVAASALTTSIIERQGLLAGILISESDRSQATWTLRGGLDWSRAVLKMDADKSPTTRQDGIWSRPIIGLPVGPANDPERALLSGQIEDEQGKYNLRNLVENSRIDPQEVLALERLFGWLGITPSLAAMIAQRVADAQLSKEGGARAVGLRSIDDLGVVQGVTAQLIDAMRPYVTVLPTATTVNVNTAKAEVLGAVVGELGLAGARELVIQRDKGLWFANRADFANRLPGRKLGVGKRVGVRSDWFHVIGEVTINDTMVTIRALLHRNDKGLSSISWVIY